VTAGMAAAGPDGGCAISQANILSPLTKLTAGVRFTIPITTTGCTAPLRSVRLATGTLPGGVELYSSPTGAELSGTPYVAGTSVVTIRAIDAAYKLPTESVILHVNEALRIDTLAVASGLPGSAYSDTIRVRGGAAPYTFSIVEGALPAGLTLNASTGAITGNMPASGNRFRVRVTDSSSPANVKESPYTIAPTGQLTTLTAPVGSVGSAYSFDIDGSLGASGFGMAIGTLPSGLTIDGNGVISGIPSAAGEFHITVRQTAGLTSVWRSYRLLINEAATILGTPRDAEEGAPYNHVFVTSGSVGPYTYAVTAGALPTGISLSSATGALTGALPISGSGSAFTITSTDATGRTHSQAFSITATTPLVGSTTVPPTVQILSSGSATPYILGGGSATKDFSIIGGVGTGQVFINPVNGSTSYSFSTAGTYTAIVLGSDSLGGAVLFNTVQYKAAGPLTIDPSVDLPNARVGVAYSTVLPVLNNEFGPVAYTITAGALPTGFTLGAATGLVSGTGNVADAGLNFTFTVTATDAVGRTATADYFIGVSSNSGFITTTSVPDATLSQLYSTTILQSGMPNPVFSNPGGGMPPGLTLSAVGVISGTPNTAGNYVFLVRLQDSVAGANNTRQYTINVSTAPSFTFLPVSPLEATVSSSTFISISPSGGRAPYSLSVSAGTLPDGLFFESFGSSFGISGTPMISGNQTFTVQLTDFDGRTASVAYTINVRQNVRITTLNADFPVATINAPFSIALGATLGLAPYTFTLASGALPAGVTLSPAGVISGTPSTGATANFSILVTDAAGRTTERSYSISPGSGFSISNAVPLANGVVLNSYSAVFSTGLEANSTRIIAGDLPPLLYISSSSGGIVGVPVVPGVYNFTAEVSDGEGRTATQAQQITIVGGLSFTPVTVPNGVLSSPYSVTFLPANNYGGVVWSIVAGGPPPGVTLNPATGVLSGTPNATGPFSFTVQAVDAGFALVTQNYTMQVLNFLTINPATVPNGTVGANYSQVLTASGGSGGTSWAVTAGALPGGLTLGAANGILSGIPTTGGTFNFTVTATDSFNQTGSRAYTLTVLNTLVITPTSLPNGTINSAYSQQLTATGGTGAIGWAVTAGALPAGVTLAPSTGILAGTPTASGAFNFTVTATDSLTQIGTRAYSLTINGVLAITPNSLPNGTINTAYSQQLSATGGTGAIAWAVTAGALPAGVTLAPSTGILAGTPTASGAFNFTVTATDSLTQLGSQAYTLTIANTLAITPASLPNGTINTAYSQQLTATGALGIALFQLTAGALPAGLTLANNGVISGTPTTVGTATFDVTVATPQQQVATRTLTLTVLDPLAIATAALPDATELEAYTTTLTATGGGASGLSWTLLTGALPPGVSLATTGVLSGTPTQHGTYPFTVQLVNAAGTRVTKALSLLVVQTLSITTLSLGETVQGRSYTATLTALGGRAPFTWSLVNSTLPTGLQLNPSTGQITGTTSVAEGPYPQTVAVTDSRGRVARRTLPFTVAVPPPPSLNISPTAIPNGRVNQAYSAGFSATGGTPGYSFAIVQGAPPTGLTLNAGTLSGTPTQEGTFRFTVNATDSQGRVAGNQYTVVIEPALVPLVVTPSSIAPTTQVGQPLTLQFGATGGKAPYSFAITGNTPPGTSSNSSGVLSGTPSQGGTFSFTVQVTDSLGDKASRGYSLSITGNLVITTQPPLAEGTTGKPYSLSFGATGGRQPYTWSVSGTTPPGLAFNNGDLSGTPTTAGTFNFSVTVQDPQQLTATAAFSLTIWDPVTITNTPADTPLLTGQPFNFTYSTRGGKPPVTLALTGGALPAGLTFANGVITGTPTGPGNFAFTVQATDGLGNTTVQSSALRVVAPLTVTTTALPSGAVGTAYSAAVAAAGGVAPLGTWSLSQGTLPAGLTLAPDGAITGTPTAAGTSTFTVRITDAANTAATRQLAINIQLPPVPPLVLPGLPQALPPGTQTNITIQLAQPFPVPVTGTLTLIFEPNAINNADDPSVQFSSGGRTVTFVIPPGQTAGTFPVTPLRLLSGTVAGTIRIRITTSPESATPVPDAIVPITRSAPVITAGTAQLSATSFTLLIDGFSNTREIVSATFRLTPTAGSSLATTDVPVNVAATFAAYYQSPASVPFGGQFRLTQPFNVNGPLTDIDSVVVTVTNSVGTSQPFTIRLR